MLRELLRLSALVIGRSLAHKALAMFPFAMLPLLRHAPVVLG
jgi:hypothetical protein